SRLVKSSRPYASQARSPRSTTALAFGSRVWAAVGGATVIVLPHADSGHPATPGARCGAARSGDGRDVIGRRNVGRALLLAAADLRAHHRVVHIDLHIGRVALVVDRHIGLLALVVARGVTTAGGQSRALLHVVVRNVAGLTTHRDRGV